MTAVARPGAIAAPVATSRIPRGFGRIGVHAGVIILMAIWLIPTIGLLVNSFRSEQDVSASGWWSALFPPWNLSLDNYASVLGEQGIGDAFVNSLFITIPSVIIPILVAAFAAYAFSWMSFPGRNLLFVAVVGLLVVPLQTTFIPILKLYAGLYGLALTKPAIADRLTDIHLGDEASMRFSQLSGGQQKRLASERKP